MQDKFTILNKAFFKVSLLIYLCVLSTISSFAQKERHYIYLFDCTKSMVGYKGSPEVMPQTLSFLRRSIGSLPNGTKVSVVPFQDKVLKTYSCYKEDFDFNEYSDYVANVVEQITNTNICDPWKKGESLIDKDKDNYLILLTDGGDNVNGISALVDLLRDFCGKYKNTRGFYVKLTTDAIDLSKPGARDLLDVLERCPWLYSVDATKGISTFFSVDLANASTNTLMLNKPLTAKSSAMEKIKLHAECNDPYFDVNVENDESDGGKFKLNVTSKVGGNVSDLNSRLQSVVGDGDYALNFKIVVDDKQFELCNPNQSIRISNKPERMVEFANMTDVEVKIPGAEYYPSCLFWSAKDLDTLKFDLTPNFNNEAKKDNSFLQVSVLERSGAKDYKVLLNGNPISDNSFTLDKNSGNTVLGIVFNPDAKEGKRYFDFKFSDNKAQNLERINSDEVKDASFCLRTTYGVSWNPLSWILLILACVILSALILWFLIFKPMNYPHISVGMLQVEGDEYFVTKRIKGARMVVLADKAVPQSFLNRLFTGEVMYVVSPEWTKPIYLTSRKKGVKVKTDYSVYDIDSSMLIGEEYKVKNAETKRNYKFILNK